MKEAREVLVTLARTVSAFAAYGRGHPARERALDALLDAVLILQERVPEPTFSFPDAEVIFEARPLRGLVEWPWSERFFRVGVQRVEFAGPVDRDDLLHFVDDLTGRLRRGGSMSSEARVTRPTRIRYGLLQIGDEGQSGSARSASGRGASGSEIDLGAEAGALRYLESDLRTGGVLHLAEAEGVVHSLLQAMHGDRHMLLPLTRLKEFDQYTTTHALNVSVLAMALAEEVGLDADQVRAFGISGLLHDLGKVRIPKEILTKPGALTDAERTLMNSHTVEGARVIFEHDADLDLAAVVAYEHHRRTDGGGYPEVKVARRCHEASDLVHVCDVYDALRTHRPYREAWAHERVMAYINEAAGTEFDTEMVRAFSSMMERCPQADGRIDDPSPEVDDDSGEVDDGSGEITDPLG